MMFQEKRWGKKPQEQQSRTQRKGKHRKGTIRLSVYFMCLNIVSVEVSYGGGVERGEERAIFRNERKRQM